MKRDKITAIIVAAGQGKRMNSTIAKQFLILRDKPILYYVLKAFNESPVDEIILVTGKDQVDYCKKEIVGFYGFDKVFNVIEGGKERFDSVSCALKSIKQTDYVLIHDGARPFISRAMIEHVIHQVKVFNACIVGTPVKETIKIINEENMIIDTPNRSVLWSAQTPQAFKYTSISTAYEDLYKEINLADLCITDDAMVYERYMKQPVKMLLGEYTNIKITTPEDLIVAEMILKNLLYE